MTCECVSLNCIIEAHRDLECTQPAKQRIISRDWGEAELQFCFWCAKDAVVSGMFLKVTE